ncbi:dTMP kinase [Ignavigranum ruoffiae]|uniref:Thymidylate kinase n=1 Tax=Ignavigranum ruoffiae TaxID=89093 RepID=A0A1H9BLE8_9LACT|nr:dTMP kinase [Ignavigranum ruoffiae]SEP89353.1 thymidylate kinase [Ignavigranum ruoffiae]
MTVGKFISIEGPDGSGKTSVLQKIRQELEARGYPLVTTREPGGSPIAEQIREIILDVDNTKMDGRTEALLFAAQRRQHMVERILPNLEAGKLVISDRFVHSSLAYQGVARDITLAEIWQINQFAIQNHYPDLILLIDVPAEIGLRRIYAARGQRQFDRLDQEDVRFHHKVRQAFLNLAQEDPRMVVVDGQEEIERVAEKCIQIMEQRELI